MVSEPERKTAGAGDSEIFKDREMERKVEIGKWGSSVHNPLVDIVSFTTIRRPSENIAFEISLIGRLNIKFDLGMVVSFRVLSLKSARENSKDFEN
jgi:hypothetical protein